MRQRKRAKNISEDAVVPAPAAGMSSHEVLGTRSDAGGFMSDGNFLLPARAAKTAVRGLYPKKKRDQRHWMAGDVFLSEAEAAELRRMTASEALAAVRECFPEASRAIAIAWCPASGKLFVKAEARDGSVKYAEAAITGAGISCRPQTEAVSGEEAKRAAGGREVKLVWKNKGKL